MLKNFLKITLRSLIRRKKHALLNIIGLTMGMGCCLFIFEYTSYERSYEGFNRHADRIFRIQDEYFQNGRMVVPCASAMPGAAPTLKREFPQIQDACRLIKSGYMIGNDARNIVFREEKLYCADEAMITIFQVHLLKGDPSTALVGPSKIILSASEARKYFGTEEPVGKELSIHANGKLTPLLVTGVFQDYPLNSHIRFDMVASYTTRSVLNGTFGIANSELETSFDWTDFYTYILLKKGIKVEQVAARLPEFINRHYNSLPQARSDRDSFTLSLMPLPKIHLYSHYTEEAEPNGDAQSVNFLFLIAFFVIGIAWINYINLATARSLERAREVGMRKVLGAKRKELVMQFMLESLLLNIFALGLAMVLVALLNPLFARFINRPLDNYFSLPAVYWGIFGLLFLAGTFLSGLYPALVLSGYRPVIVLKGYFKNTAQGAWLRKSLIVGQFAASIALIAGTLIVYRQMQYMRGQSLGANIDQTIVVRAATASLPDSAYNDEYQSFKEDLLKIQGVKNITSSSNVMGQEILWSTDWYRLRASDKHAVNIFMLGVDDQFITNYGLRMVAGRNFSPSFQTDKHSVVLNESAVKALGYSSPAAALGELVSGGQPHMDSLHIIGVVADYHHVGLQYAITPLAFLNNYNNRHLYSIKAVLKNPAATVAAIKRVWEKHFPRDPYDYFFLDEFFAHQYAEDQQFGEVFALFAMLAIGIACFGLLGLSAYNVLQRTREIGIRKVLGASVPSLLYALSRDFLMMVLIGFALAIPITWMVMSGWLQNFAYRTSIGWWVFAVAGIFSLLVALVTVGLHSLKAAFANPVKSLRTE